MDEKKNTTIEDTVEQAERLEAKAKAEPDNITYTHTFQKPFTYQGTTYDKLTFNWDSLSGKDSIAIERELINRRLTVVTAEYTPEYLAAMAARACTYRNDDGFRTVNTDMLYALPLPEFRQICEAARVFLLKSRLRQVMAEAGSGNNA